MNPLRPLETPLAGLQLIEASAGTGKTFAITTLALRAVIEAALDISRILIVTFTNAATAELRRRLRERLHRALEAYADIAAASDDEDLRTLVGRRAAQGQADADRRRLRLALDGFDEAAIFTIHGFCQRALREFAFESGAAFDVELIGDPRPLLADAVRDVWTTRLYDAPPAMVDRLAAEGVTPDTVARVAGAFALHRDLRVRATPAPAAPGDVALEWTRQFMREAGPAVLETLGRRKAAANVQDFDDLLHQLAAALGGSSAGALAGAIARRYGLALIDEFQDTDPVQYRIFHAVHAQTGLPLFLIGDPKQAIYAFRGADVFAYLAAQTAATETHTLLTNWRSAPRLVEAVNALFSDLPDPFVIREIRFRSGTAAARNVNTLGGPGADGPPLRIAFARRADHGVPESRRLTKPGRGDHWLCRALADQLVRLLDGSTTLDGRRLRAGDIAVLCRTNAQLTLVGEALRGAGIPSVALGDASVFEAPEAQMLEHVLRALAEPGDAAALRVALVTPLIGFDSDALARLNADESEWDLWAERFQRWSERWRVSGFTAALRGLFDELSVPERVLGRPDGERCLTNLLHLGELLQQAASAGRRGPHNLVEWLHRLRSDATLRRELGSEAAQIRLESDVHAVTLTTVHKSKGLEYPVVVCPFQWESFAGREDRRWPCFHDGQGRLTIDVSMPPAADSVARRDREAAAEDVRLLYVAVTRAKQLCVLVWGAFNSFEGSALAGLLHRHPLRNLSAASRDGKAIRGLSDAAIAADLAALAAASNGSIAIEPLAPPQGLCHVGVVPDGAVLVPPASVPAIERAWRIGSFTSLSAGAEMLDTYVEEVGRDRDEVAADAEPGAGPTAGLRGFPRGRGPGTLVHRILEGIDFGASDTALRDVVERELMVARTAREWGEPLTGALRDVLDTPLLNDPDALRLRDVPRAHRLTEMEFAFPVGRGGARQPLTAAALAEVFALYGATAEAAYAARLRRLPFRPLAGYLRGYIDCVFAHRGRWYVVDYKTNDLGPTPSHYAPAALAVEMARHDYVLQAHLYLVALHRYLQRRLPGYDYDRDVGGALYLFLRGMAPVRGPATGVVHARPPAALVARLSEVLAG